MFKNLMVFRIGTEWAASVEETEKNLEKARFVECGKTQMLSFGWVEPRGIKNGPLVEAVGGHMLLKLQTEQKIVPGSAIKRRVAELSARHEEETGHKPGKKLKKELKEQALLDLLPMAFTKIATVNVWIDPKSRLLMVGASSQARCDEVLTALAQNLDKFSATHVHTEKSAQVLMSDWLLTWEPPESFSIDRECELKSADEMKSVVRYSRHPLDVEDVRQHITAGKMPTKLAITWNDRVSFLLTESSQLRKIDFLDSVMDGRKEEGEDPFDTDAAIATGELSGVVLDLITALGGEALEPAPAA